MGCTNLFAASNEFINQHSLPILRILQLLPQLLILRRRERDNQSINLWLHSDQDIKRETTLLLRPPFQTEPSPLQLVVSVQLLALEKVRLQAL
jgi:hypothetical protein